jgi:hypothetical protein
MTDSTANPAPAPLNLADFDAAKVYEILDGHADADCHALNKVFWKAKDGAEGAAARALELLAGICSMRLVPEEPAHIYRPMVEWSDGGTSMAPGHIPKDAVDALAQLAATLPSAPLRARIADLVWLLERSRERQFPLMAVQAYRALPLSSDAWYGESRTAWHRALQLAKQIRAEDEASAIEAALLDAFFAAAGDEDGYQALHYLHPLRAERRSGGRAQEVAEQLEAIGRHRIALMHTFVAQAHFEAAAEWYEWAGDRDRHARMLSLAAEAIALQAGQADGAIVEHHWLGKAIEAYRRVPGRFRGQLGVEAAIDALRRKREDAGHAMLGEMVMIPGPREDVRDRVQGAVDHVKGRAAFQALLAFCGLDSPPDVAALRAAAEATLKATPLSTMMGKSVVAGDGRQVENLGPEAGWQAQVDAQARAMFLEHAGKAALAELLPARAQLRFEHDFRLGYFIAIAERSPVVPADRARMLGQGLYAGFCGDMVQAMHILMPQFEHVVRQILRGAGAFTAQHDKEGLDMEVALGSLVERPQMAEEFGDGLTLAIHAVMCDRAGPNLRNDVAHGLADEEACESAHALYAWWLVLQLVTETCAAAMDAGGVPAPAAPSGIDPRATGQDT